jgi:hypothetical protein
MAHAHVAVYGHGKQPWWPAATFSLSHVVFHKPDVYNFNGRQAIVVNYEDRKTTMEAPNDEDDSLR